MEINLIFLAIIFIAVITVSYYIGRLVRAREIKEQRQDAIMRSRAVLGGQFSEQLAPFLPDFPYSPTECRFIGKPIDFIVFKGMDEKEIEEVVFVEVKSGKSKISPVEKKLKETIEKKKVRFEEYRVDERVTRKSE